MADYQKGSHTIYDIKYHLVWLTKYRYQVLKDEVGLRLRELIRQSCLSRGITIIKGSIGKEPIHLLSQRFDLLRRMWSRPARKPQTRIQK